MEIEPREELEEDIDEGGRGEVVVSGKVGIGKGENGEGRAI